jgi:ribosome-associated protein
MAQTTISVILTQSPTELYKILKFEGLSSSGAEAKMAIADGLVKVNGIVERQKRKKIIAGDVVEFEGNILNISCED